MTKLENVPPVVAEIFTISKVLEEVPLHDDKPVQRLYSTPNLRFLWPDTIRVHCVHPNCDGVRRHSRRFSSVFMGDTRVEYHSAAYLCENCQEVGKVFVLRSRRAETTDTGGICTKVYQEPPFGDPAPKGFFEMLGESNRDNFLKARRAIARGLGVGAYAYYRRIIENNKAELVQSILNVAEKTGAPANQIALLKQAVGERQFSRAIEMLGDIKAIPAALLINGHNPLSLLHDLLSEGIHALSDEDCLERAKEAEIVLFETARLIQTAVSERREVHAALSKISARKAAHPT